MAGTDFAATFTALARQLAGPDFAAQWVALADQRATEGREPITAEDAAGWANLGYTPSEAAAEMSRGITLTQARDTEERETNRARWGTRIYRDRTRIA